MFIDRNENGKIRGVFNLPQYEGQEQIADDAAELLEFLNPTPTPEQIAAQEREALIQAKMREMAEAELIKAGLLTA